MHIKSPLTGSDNVEKESEIRTDFLIKHYREQLGVDVRNYFKGIDTVGIYRCLDSGYRFYHPFNITGDGKFYEELQKNAWYYMDWKWEHGKALAMVRDAKTVLEVGCAQGEFLEKVHAQKIDCTGLELNAHAAGVGRKKGLHILEESIQDHARKNKERYDVVCSFQVAEHIAPIGEFLRASLDALKPGGKLIISVPNNDSIVFKSGNDMILNMPPHHMGLWDMHSLISLQRFFPVRIEDILLEPLQTYHKGYARDIIQKKLHEKLKKRSLAWLPGVGKISNRFINMNVQALVEYIIGHTIMAVYTKK
ncbi:hypothetical protein A3C91_02350 [Candidatus Azambacteria bacterium RIFCSPHIGHO2_02_FULL_52_12]|uniref:Methyltransferase domain-containing protein n=1 Tax=Candidatus Azambacteria bacterium RIFCSPLOWO2_01_FULL_46_25 TaxID=1797298 RepID=A0A1F5BVM5_9BACT|nr:MAG: hypothetical protein A3C91_02350 [Candidatus Azambacteria bacterium RIFCSPHIGHO2_02_FULL_52_12]OGD34664.1 MAG: hypothetical protein A2988_04150 [Candidatus Azambacteria bacterium RIFCSPLOWO2_01_FULL_46_25]